jgi:2-oxoisovalerate dehydrogenase E2 component (dihydrolipoyl transacylase)
MARYLFRLPDVGEGVTEAEIMDWHVRPGDEIDEDHPLVDVMTDKANVEMTSPVAGKVLAIHGEPGDVAAVGSTLVELEIEGDADAEEEPFAKPPASGETATARHSPPTTAGVATIALAATAVPTTALAAPATRQLALKLGMDLESVPGSGPGGRITPTDLEHYAAQQIESEPGVTETRIIGLRRTIAERMQDSKSRIPHFAYVEEFDLSELELLRKASNDNRDSDQPKLTLLPFFMRAIVALRDEFPDINARYDDQANILRSYERVHIGIATQTDNGLVVPVVKDAESLDIWDCAREVARLSSAARDGSATREELSGSTITITSLGALGGISATPVINSPEVAIIGPNKLVQRPVVIDGEVAIRTMMNVSSSFDHRIVDGYEAARFIQQLKVLIENPAALMP